MLRLLKIIILAALMVAIIIVALANREMVTVKLLPEQMSTVLPLSIDLPLFAIVLISILTGLTIGYIIEYLREHKHRRLAAEKKREVGKLEREVEKLKKQHQTEEDEILALLN